MDSWDKCWGQSHEGVAPLAQLLLKVLHWGAEVTKYLPPPLSPSTAEGALQPTPAGKAFPRLLRWDCWREEGTRSTRISTPHPLRAIRLQPSILTGATVQKRVKLVAVGVSLERLERSLGTAAAVCITFPVGRSLRYTEMIPPECR